jgi:lipopolysaccharide transport protein LptA
MIRISAIVFFALMLSCPSSAGAAPPAKKKVEQGKKSSEARVSEKPSPTPAPKKNTGGLESALKGSPGQGGEPMFIRSDNFQLDSKNRLFIYRDNVEIVKGDLTITADVMNGKYDANNHLEEVVCENNVVITRGDRLRATSNRAFYDVRGDKITLTEGPELNDRGNVLTADRVIILVKEDRSEAEGHVRVKVVKSDGQADVLKNMKRGSDKNPVPTASGGE